jgi:hypothetical protein
VEWLLEEFAEIGLTRGDAEKVAMMRDSKDGDAREKYDVPGSPGWDRRGRVALACVC